MRILRFQLSARVLHWSHALVFIWLLITGVELFLTPKSLLGDPLIKMIHLYVSPLFVLLPGAIYISGKRPLQNDVAELMTWTDSDLRWFMDIFLKKENITGKFNGGQKANFLITSLLILGLSFSGTVVWMKSMFSVEFVEMNFMAHDLFAIIAILLFSGHIMITLYYKESLRGIIYGAVDEKWAEKHYPEWFKKEKNS